MRIKLDTKYSDFVKICILVMGIGVPVKVRMHSRKITGSPYIGAQYAFHNEDKTVSHFEIDCIQTQTRRGGTYTVLAHELVHCFVDLNYPRATVHGRTFQRACASMRKALKEWGYSVDQMYLKGVDR